MAELATLGSAAKCRQLFGQNREWAGREKIAARLKRRKLREMHLAGVEPATFGSVVREAHYKCLSVMRLYESFRAKLKVTSELNSGSKVDNSPSLRGD